MVAAVQALVLVLLAGNLLITAGLVRKLRALLTDGRFQAAPHMSPQAGFKVILPGDDNWPNTALEMVNGVAVVVFAIPACTGCVDIRQEIADRPLTGSLLYVIADGSNVGNEAARQYLASTWTDAAATFVAPGPVADLTSFDRTSAFPTIVIMSDGVVLASGYRFRDVEPVLDRVTEGHLSSPRTVRPDAG